MAKKEFTYRGKTLDELKMMEDKEFMALVPSRQRRTFRRGYTDAQKKLIKEINANKENIETHCRNFIILPKMVGNTIKVHNGKQFTAVIIQPEMIGHYLGEFALTRNRVMHNAPGIGATRSSAAISVR